MKSNQKLKGSEELSTESAANLGLLGILEETSINLKLKSKRIRILGSIYQLQN